uniref:Putative ovule protein n=1 Tax=Solanum chacoense TaxID=4108 RepID=A0A0V0HBI0_SOLCH
MYIDGLLPLCLCFDRSWIYFVLCYSIYCGEVMYSSRVIRSTLLLYLHQLVSLLLPGEYRGCMVEIIDRQTSVDLVEL